MISVNQGPNINAGLGALTFDKTFQAGREGVRAIAQAGMQKDAEVKEAYAKMTENFKASQITASRVVAAMENNPMLFQGLEEGDDLASKSYQKFVNGTYAAQDVNNLLAYIETANTQQENALKTKTIEDNKKIAEGIAQVTSLSYGNLSESEYDNVSKSDIMQNTMQVLQNYTDPVIKNAIYGGGSKLAEAIDGTDDTAQIRNINRNSEDLQEFKEAWTKGDDFRAYQIVNSNPYFLEIYPVYDVMTNSVSGVQSPDTIAANMGLTRIKPEGSGEGSVSSKPVIELDVQEIEKQFLVNGVWEGSMLTEDQVMNMSEEAIEAYVAKFAGEFAQPGSTEQVEANAILSPSEVLVATTAEPVKPNKPKLQSYIAKYAKGFALGSEPYKLAEKMYESDKSKYEASMIKYKEQIRIYKNSNSKRRN